MPSNIFANTGTNVSIMFLDSTKEFNEVMLVDATGLGDKIKVDGKNQKTVLQKEEIDRIISTLPLKLNDAQALNKESVLIKDVTLTGADLKEYSGDSYAFNINSIIYGDVNNDGAVDISDYIGVANYILGHAPNGFNEIAADVNNDETIDISDYIGVANIILKGKP